MGEVVFSTTTTQLVCEIQKFSCKEFASFSSEVVLSAGVTTFKVLLNDISTSEYPCAL